MMNNYIVSDIKVEILHSSIHVNMIRSRNHNDKAKDGLSHQLEFRLKMIVFGLIAGLISSIGISTLIMMVEKITPVPAGAFYVVIVSTITQSHSYSVYMIIAGLLLHFAAGSLIGIVMAIPFNTHIYNNKTDILRTINKYAPVYGICFGFALWLVLFIPITYSMVLPALNNIKEAPMITQQDPTGRVVSLVIGDILSMENRIIIGALAFNMFYGLVTAIIINSLYIKYLYKKKSFEDIVDQGR
jgi:hypothetical protein